jgi:hypothetical protein
MPLWRAPLARAASTLVSPLVYCFFHPGTSIETSLDAARTSACATQLPGFVTYYTRNVPMTLLRRVHVVLPVDLIADIGKLVGKRGRSAFLTEVARREVMINSKS